MINESHSSRWRISNVTEYNSQLLILKDIVMLNRGVLVSPSFRNSLRLELFLFILIKFYYTQLYERSRFSSACFLLFVFLFYCANIYIFSFCFSLRVMKKFQNYRNRHRTLFILFRNWTLLKFKSLLFFTINENSERKEGNKCFMVLRLCFILKMSQQNHIIAFLIANVFYGWIFMEI